MRLIDKVLPVGEGTHAVPFPPDFSDPVVTDDAACFFNKLFIRKGTRIKDDLVLCRNVRPPLFRKDDQTFSVPPLGKDIVQPMALSAPQKSRHHIDGNPIHEKLLKVLRPPPLSFRFR